MKSIKERLRVFSGDCSHGTFLRAWLHRSWRYYTASMDRRRPNMGLDWGSFLNHVTTPKYCQHVRFGKSCIYGQYNQELKAFIPSHFAPATQREGYRIVKTLMGYDDVVFCVTGDMGPMLQKAGYIKVPITFETEFRGDSVEKEVYVTSKTTVLKALAYVQWKLSRLNKEARQKTLDFKKAVKAPVEIWSLEEGFKGMRKKTLEEIQDLRDWYEPEIARIKTEIRDLKEKRNIVLACFFK